MAGLALFFTRGVSLATWAGIGSLERETLPYERLSRQLGPVLFVTYGDGRDRRLGRELAGIDVVSNRFRLQIDRYVRTLSLPWSKVRRVEVIKTNQISGAREALAVARRLGKKLYCRCGYFPSTKVAWQHGTGSPEARRARDAEQALFRAADAVAVTTEAMRKQVLAVGGVEAEKVRVVPNYVDTDLFRPPTEPRAERTVCYVGRFEAEKNVLALVDAVAPLDVELLLIGSGSLEEEIRRRNPDRARLRLLGNVPNRELPAQLGGATLFVLPSHFEHHPKALVEAMACGTAVLGADVPGIRDLIEPGVTGLLRDPAPEALRDGLVQLLDDPELRRRLGRAAREKVAAELSLERFLDRELALLATLGVAGR